MNKRLISLCANIVNQSSIQMDFDNTPMLSKLKVLLLAFTAIENFGSSTKRRFYKSFLSGDFVGLMLMAIKTGRDLYPFHLVGM